MFHYFHITFYVHFRNSRVVKSTSGVGNPCAPHPLNKSLHVADIKADKILKAERKQWYHKMELTYIDSFVGLDFHDSFHEYFKASWIGLNVLNTTAQEKKFRGFELRTCALARSQPPSVHKHQLTSTTSHCINIFMALILRQLIYMYMYLQKPQNFAPCENFLLYKSRPP